MPQLDFNGYDFRRQNSLYFFALVLKDLAIISHKDWSKNSYRDADRFIKQWSAYGE